jgi:AAA15 family ATPase/GTPase
MATPGPKVHRGQKATWVSMAHPSRSAKSISATLANLTSPTEVRSVLQIGQKQYNVNQITSDLIAFAQRVLPHRYDELVEIRAKNTSLLFAKRKDTRNSRYSEFHMSAGERALLRISREISQLNNALVLIDEVEAGLHPFTQQQFMLELQRLALRNDLQIIVTAIRN